MLLSLIDTASGICGSDAKLARTLGVSRAYVSQLRSGARPITPAIAGELAHMAHEDILSAVVAATMAQLAHTERGQVVRAELEKRFLAGAGVTFDILPTPKGTPQTSFDDDDCSHPVNNLYIV